MVSDWGSNRSPYDSERFIHRLRQVLDESGDTSRTRVPAFRRYEPLFWQSLLSEIFVRDMGAIQQEEKFEYNLRCTLAHPGFCATRDSGFLPKAKECAKTFQAILSATLQMGGYNYLHFLAGASWHKECWVRVAYIRGAGPKLVMLCSCSYNPRSKVVSLDISDSGLYCEMQHVTLLAKFFRLAGRENPVTGIWCWPVVVDRSCPHCRDFCTPISGWRELASQTEVFFI